MTHIVVIWFYAASAIFAATMAAVVIGSAVEMIRVWRNR
jgi:hypothetical protein